MHDVLSSRSNAPRRFPWLAIGLAVPVIAAILALVPAQTAWSLWVAMLIPVAAIVLYFLLGEPAWVQRVTRLRLQWRIMLPAVGYLAAAAGFYGLRGGPFVVEHWLMLVVVAIGATGLLYLGRGSKRPLLSDAAAILLVWLPIEFNLLPQLPLPSRIELSINLVQLLAIPFLAWLMLLVRNWPQLGFDLHLTWRDLRIALLAFGLFSLVALPAALLSGFVSVSSSFPPVLEIIGQGIFIWAFIALPEELLFRGMIQNGLMRVIRTPWVGLLLASVIFGAAHLTNPPDVWRYALFATVAGLSYGWTYLKTNNVVAASLVHLWVDWVWSIVLGGLR